MICPIHHIAMETRRESCVITGACPICGCRRCTNCFEYVYADHRCHKRLPKSLWISAIYWLVIAAVSTLVTHFGFLLFDTAYRHAWTPMRRIDRQEVWTPKLSGRLEITNCVWEGGKEQKTIHRR